jgi:ABC-type phosphate/phosphonate transport system substrate-binding protein
MGTKTRELTWANVDVDDNAEMEEFRQQEERKARERAQEAVRRLQEQGIMDAHGRRVRKDLPPDMREDSECDLG